MVEACKPHKVIGSDLAWLRRRANEAAAGRKLDWSTSRSCGSAEHAVAFISARPERRPDATELHGFVRCERDSVRWKCEWGQSRLITVPIVSAGAQRSVRLRIEGEIEASLAIPLLRHATDLAPTLQLAQVCGLAGERPASEYFNQRLQLVREDLKFAGTDPMARVTLSGDGYLVDVDDSYFLYRPAASAATAFEFHCWGNEPPPE
jgi:hypothetical protein